MDLFSDLLLAKLPIRIEFETRDVIGGFRSAEAPWPMADVELDASTGRYRFWRSDLEGELLGERARFVCGPSPSSRETCARLVASILLPRHGALLMHASAAIIAGEAHGRARVFSGPSGAGKSTMVGLVGGVSLGDEMVALRSVEGRVVAYSTPFAGTRARVAPHQAPVEGIYFITDRSAPAEAPIANRAARLTAPAAVARLLRNTVSYARGEADIGACLSAAEAIALQVPTWSWSFVPTPEVVGYLHSLPVFAS